MLRILLLTLIMFSNTIQSAELSKQYSKCMSSTKTNSEWSDCSKNEIAYQENTLNKVWGEVSKEMKTYSRNAFESLLSEQRAWIKYKDVACGYYVSVADDGTPTFGREGTALHFGACKASIIAERIEYLKVAIPK